MHMSLSTGRSVFISEELAIAAWKFSFNIHRWGIEDGEWYRELKAAIGQNITNLEKQRQ